ncbi:MAG: DUF3592 domain-containing protein [Corynebacterium sp.]|nr:DUF3592 domain-containing protein [Corynebacterium sp.]
MTHRLYRRIQQLILLLWGCCIIITCSLVLGPYKDDREIMAHAVRVPATVRVVQDTYVGVEFQDLQGNYHSPSNGVLYPAKMNNLKSGDMIWVIYDWRDPELAKVEGRSWVLVLPLAAEFFIISTIICWSLRFGLHRFEFRDKKTATTEDNNNEDNNEENKVN